MSPSAKSLRSVGLRVLLALLALAAPRPFRAAERTTANQAASKSVFDVALPPPDPHNGGDIHLSPFLGMVQPKARENQTIDLPKFEDMNVIMLGDSTLRYVFRSPTGSLFVPGEMPDFDGFSSGRMGGLLMFRLERPERGRWTVTVDAAASSRPAHYGIVISTNESVEEQPHLETMTRDSDPRYSMAPVEPGTPVYVRAFVVKGDRPVPGVEWKISARTYPSDTLQTPQDTLQEIPVFDDGHHADGTADDGIYVGTLRTQAPDALYQVFAEAKTPRGIRYTTSDFVKVQAKYDLLIAGDIVVSPDPRVGKPVTLTVTVKNDGHHDYRGVGFELDVDQQEERGSRQTFDLKAGESRRIVVKWTPYNAGDHKVNLSIDPFIEPDEVDYANNARRTTVKVR
jgi:hypothetical protein